MKRKEYIKPAARVRQLYTEGSVMEDFQFPVGSPNGGGGNQEMEDDEAFSKEYDFSDFEYPEGKSVWED